ncbi:MAG: hypothetical protein H8E31_14695 [Planctomycetes bacterium]|nr:hypothetical protein [Planctomycetota bacterium]
MSRRTLSTSLLIAVLLGAVAWVLFAGASTVPNRGDQGSGLAPALDSAVDADARLWSGDAKATGGRETLSPAPDPGAPADAPTSGAVLALETWDVAAAGSAAGVELRVQEITQSWPWPEIASGRSDEDGRLEVEVPVGTALVLRLERGRDFLHVQQRLAPLEVGRHALRVRMHPMPVSVIAVHVTDIGGRPLPGAVVHCEGREAESWSTGPDGRVRIAVRERWLSLIEVEKEGYASTYRMVEDGQEDILVQLDRSARLRGLVLDESGQPAVWVGVELRASPRLLGSWLDEPLIRRQARTAADGGFELDELWPGRELGLSLDAGASAAVLVVEALKPGDNSRTFHLQPRPRLRGLVMDASGRPIPGVVLEAEQLLRLRNPEFPGRPRILLGGSPRLRQATDEQGVFVFGVGNGLVAGTWRIGTAGALDRQPGRRPVARADDWLPMVREVEIGPGDQEEPLTLILERGLFIDGVLLDPEGRPLAEGHVRGSPVRGSGSGDRPGPTELGADGRWRLGPLSPGRYHLAGGNYDLGLSAEAQDVEAGASGVVLRCAPSARILGQVVGPDGVGRLAVVYGMTRIDGDTEIWAPSTDGDGRFEIVVGQATTWDLFAFTRDGAAAMQVEVGLAEGETRELELRLEAGAEVSFRGLSEDGPPRTARLFLRGQRIWEGDADYLENLRQLPEGQLRLELWRGTELVGEGEALLLGGIPAELVVRAVAGG